MNSANLLFIVGGLVGAGLAIRGLFRPFLGLMVLMTLHFVQPGDMIPALAPLRLELIYGILMLLILLKSKRTEIKRILRTDKIVQATLLLEAVVVFTIPFAIWKGGAFESATELAKMIMLQLLMTFFIDSQDRLRSIMWLMIAFLMWFAGSALTSYLNGDFYEVNGVQRAQGMNSMVGGPNQLAGLLIAFLPFVVCLIRCTSKFWARVLLLACGALSLVMLLMTGARIAFIALIVMVLWYIVKSKRKVLVMTASLVIALAIWFSLPEQYRQRYLTVKQYAQGGELDDSNKLRLAIWDAGWRMFVDHPIIGVGAGQFPTAYGMVYSGNQHGAWMQPHNLFLQVPSELGIVGVIAFGNLLFQIIKANRFVLRQRDVSGTEINYRFASACSFMFIGVFLISTVSHTLYRPYWYLLAGLVSSNLAITVGLLAKRKERKTVPLRQKPKSIWASFPPKTRESLTERRWKLRRIDKR